MTVPVERSERNEALPLETLAYDDLARAYREGLVTRLRGFQVGPEFLDAWVDDEEIGDVRAWRPLPDPPQ